MSNPLDAFVGVKTSLSDIRINKMPQLEEALRTGRNGGLGRYDLQMEEWRKSVERVLKQIEQVVSEITTAEDADAGTSNGDTSGGGTVVDPGLVAQLQELADDLAAHIAATVVHGTESDVVGETDEQNLERKTIGLSFPRNARFHHMLQSDQIPVGESFLVPAGTNMVVAGPFPINGTLTVEGIFAVV